MEKEKTDIEIIMEKLVSKKQKYLTKYINTKEVFGASIESIKTYTSVINSFIEYIELLITQGKEFCNNEYILHCRNVLRNKNTTIKYKFIVLKDFMNFLTKERYLSKNIIKTPYINIPKSKKMPMPKKIFEKILNSNISEKNKLMVETLVYTGMRKKELLNLKVKDVVKTGLLIGKGENVRILYFKDYIFEKLQNWIKEQKLSPNNYVFFGRFSKNKPMNKSTLNKALKPFEVCVHSTRRKFASDNSDILNVFELQDVLGHSSIETTKLYVSTNSKSILEKLNSKHEAV